MTAQDLKTQERFGTDLMRVLLHLEIVRYELEQFSQNRTPTVPSKLMPFVREVTSKLHQADKKIQWFIETTKKIVEPALAKTISTHVQPGTEHFCNIAQLSEWVITASVPVDNEVDLVVNKSRRRELIRRAWSAALQGHWSQEDELRFNAWYNVNFPSSKY